MKRQTKLYHCPHILKVSVTASFQHPIHSGPYIQPFFIPRYCCCCYIIIIIIIIIIYYWSSLAHKKSKEPITNQDSREKERCFF